MGVIFFLNVGLDKTDRNTSLSLLFSPTSSQRKSSGKLNKPVPGDLSALLMVA